MFNSEKLESFIYENHKGQRFYGLENGVFLNANELRDYKWSFDTINSRISRFFRPTTSRKIPLVVLSPYEVEAVRVKNQLYEIAEADIVAKIPGKIIAGDYYTTGFITASAKSDYQKNKRFCKIDLVFTSSDPAWYREKTHVFTPGSSIETGSGVGADFPYDYAYDFAPSANGRYIVCDSVKSNHFKLKIYGPALNPTVIINDHAYTVNGTVNGGETLMIDSVNKTIMLTTAAGAKVNWFGKRNGNSYIFEPIPAGRVSVLSNGTFSFDLTIVDERSEPKWI